jgi:hypothetical protein
MIGQSDFDTVLKPLMLWLGLIALVFIVNEKDQPNLHKADINAQAPISADTQTVIN